MDKRPALGKGLSALIPDAPAAPRPGPTEVDIDLLSPNRYQPRARVDETALAALTDSIKANGIIQPIVVRRVNDRYEIIAGERRWRAAQRAGLHRVPVAIRDVADGADQSLLEMALVENVQRADLNPIEEAEAYRRLTNEFQRTQEEVAAAVGKDRASVANYLRLLKLPEELRAEIAGGRLSMGHARALLGLADAAAQRNLSREIISRGLSVRDAEAQVRKLSGGTRQPEETPAKKKGDVHSRAAEEQLRLMLGTSVRIIRRGKKGRIEIDFKSEDELIRIYDQLTEKN